MFTGMQLERERRPSLSLFDNQKTCSNFGKGLNFVHICVKSDLGLNLEFFFLAFLTKCLLKSLSSIPFYLPLPPPPCPEKFLVVHLQSDLILFAKLSMLNV